MFEFIPLPSCEKVKNYKCFLILLCNTLTAFVVFSQTIQQMALLRYIKYWSPDNRYKDTAKIIKRWYYPPSHRLDVNVMLSNHLFYDFCSFWSMAVNTIVKLQFLSFIIAVLLLVTAHFIALRLERIIIIIIIDHLTIALCPIIASTTTIFWDVDVLRVIEIGKWRVHYRVDYTRLQVEKHSTWNIMLIVRLTFQHTQKSSTDWSI